MNNKQAKKLGALIRQHRELRGYSLRQLARDIGVQDSTLRRLEAGQYAAPSPEKLARLAQALDMPLADLYLLADYTVPADLPTPSVYLRAKFRDLPQSKLAELSREVAAVLERHGLAAEGQPQKPPARAATTKKLTKGGKK